MNFNVLLLAVAALPMRYKVENKEKVSKLVKKQKAYLKTALHFNKSK